MGRTRGQSPPSNFLLPFPAVFPAPCPLSPAPLPCAALALPEVVWLHQLVPQGTQGWVLLPSAPHARAAQPPPVAAGSPEEGPHLTEGLPSRPQRLAPSWGRLYWGRLYWPPATSRRSPRGCRKRIGPPLAAWQRARHTGADRRHPAAWGSRGAGVRGRPPGGECGG